MGRLFGLLGLAGRLMRRRRGFSVSAAARHRVFGYPQPLQPCGCPGDMIGEQKATLAQFARTCQPFSAGLASDSVADT